MRRTKTPVQQWVDSLPSPEKFGNSTLESVTDSQSETVDSFSLPVESAASTSESAIDQFNVSVDSELVTTPTCTVEQVFSDKDNLLNCSNMTVSTPIFVPNSPTITCSGVSRLVRDPSFQSDDSHCSSVESLLELRRADPEAILLSLGFGGGASSPQDQGPLSRIPKRFLQPSRLRGIVINDFVKQQQETSESLDSASLGYRGLTGSPHVVPSEIVRKIMQRLREQESHELDAYLCHHNGNNQINCNAMDQDHSRLSVLSPDNRQYLERPRSKSPDMRNKRMIIGQKSFAFGNDGDLIEIKSPLIRQSSSQDSDDVFTYQDRKEFLPQSEASTIAINCSSSTPKKSSLTCIRTIENGDTIDTDDVQFIPVNLNHNFNNDTRDSSKESQNEEISKNDNKEQSGECLSSEVYQKSLFADQNKNSKNHNKAHSDEIKETFDPSCRRKSVLKRQSNIETDIAVSFNKLDTSTDTYKDECEESELSCCYKKKHQLDSKKDLEKVSNKNKQLEDGLAQNRNEVADFKDVLSSVLSVRMEPGF